MRLRAHLLTFTVNDQSQHTQATGESTPPGTRPKPRSVVST